jgi:heterotetrameric sarcosine oxidase gamma subunit
VADTTTTTMPRHRGPFDGHKAGAFPARDGQIRVQLRAGTLPGLLQIATWPSGVAPLRAALASALGLAELPQRCGLVLPTSAGMLLCTGPEEYQLLVDASGTGRAGELRQHISADVGSVVDLGHARCCIRIDGTNGGDVMSKLFALDLREASWPVGELRLTGHHHVPCVAIRRAVDGFDLLVFSTYAFDQLATVLDAALEYGVSLTLVSDGAD